jgi:hypothetical protein
VSTARHHAEWLALVETSGPFLGMPVLLQAFPQGLDAHDADLMATLRLAFEEWDENQEGARPDPAIHQTWVRWVLTEVLDLPKETLAEGQAIPPSLRVAVPEQAETLAPDVVVQAPPGGAETNGPRLLVQMWPRAQDLRRAVAGRHWNASPETRMAELLRLSGVRLGLATNGEHWLLVNVAPGETAGFASWYASLWLEERLTLQAFRSLLGAHRFFGVAAGERLEALLEQSAGAQQEVTDQLGFQVRRAVEVLVHALDRADREQDGTLLEGVADPRLYEAAVTVMMRLVFLFAAEERGLLPTDDQFYSQHYAVSSLRALLRTAADQHGEEVLERRTDAWHHLLAAFRAVHSGIRHDRLTLPAYGGSLFDPDRFPFLEGRQSGASWLETPARPLPVNNRTVLHLLDALQVLQVRVPGGGPAEARRLSFRALDIEQIGHVYEGLLDHTAQRAAGPVVGLVGTREREPEVSLTELERLRTRGDDELVSFLEEQTGRSDAAVRKALTYEPVGEDVYRLLAACDNDLTLERRVRPFARLVRSDTLGHPLVIREGSVYVTQGTDRRSTGTHYTPRSLTEPLVRYALEPLVFDGPKEGRPREQWRLRAALDLLALRICDMAMGSGAFLVQACRYLADRLVEAWAEAERAHPGAPGITPEGAASTGSPGERLIPADAEERVILARRLITDRCLYGVDRNPLAVEMAKLSLWLVTLRKDRAFTFLDHALRCGDSLLGVTALAQVESFHMDATSGQQVHLWAQRCREALNSAIAHRRQLESFTVEDLRDAQEKARLLAEADAALAEARLLGDILIGAALTTAGKKASALDSLLRELAFEVGDALTRGDRETIRRRRDELLGVERHPERRPFHWVLEFPEVSGFDGILGNPPFLGGQKITGVLGTDYRNYLVRHLAGGKRGSADLCAYFFLRAGQMLREGGNLAMLATNTIAQGDTREVGLEQLVTKGFAIPRAAPSRKWPGTANLEVAHVWVHRGAWGGERVLDDQPVASIGPFLTVPGKVPGKPYRLAANRGKSFQGSIVLGMGFVLAPDEAEALIARNPPNRDVVFPYLNGEDLNSRPDQSPSRWVINFRNWPLRRGAPGRWRGAETDQRREWLRDGILPNDYPEPVAADFPNCLEIVEEKVKPEREQNRRKIRRERWWQFAERADDLYTTIGGMNRVLVRAQVSKHQQFAFVSTRIVLDQKLVCVAFATPGDFALLQSSIHDEWALLYGVTLETRPTYTPSTCFETFPFPVSTSSLDLIGDAYYGHRQSIMVARREGFTKIGNRFHDAGQISADVQHLQRLHVDMDLSVVAAYGWSDLDLGHTFRETKQGGRFSISEKARQEVLSRLLALNHERYADEVRRGLHDPARRRRDLESDENPE